jgi:DNA-binding transcriptional LysR family regulator
MDMNRVDLNLLVSLDVLLEEANVTRAAGRLKLSQPALSAQLARLRELFGDPLLLPAETGRGMTLTARASGLREPLRAALRDLDRVVTHAPEFDPAHSTRAFQIALSDNGVAILGVDLVAWVAAHAGPGIRVAFRPVDPGRIGAQLESGEVDLLISIDSLIPSAMKARVLLKDNYCMAQRKGHPRGTAPPDLDVYCALSHVLVSPDGGGFRGFMDEYLQRLGRRRQVAVSVPQYHLMPDILEATDYVGVMPSRLCHRFAARLDAFELPIPTHDISLYASWHPRMHADAAHQWLRERVAAIAKATAA